MKILHVTIGNVYKKNGGLSKYCRELSATQIQQGHKCFYLYPGNLNIFNKTPKIKKISDDTYVLKNALPLSIFYGIDDPNRYMKKCQNIDAFEIFFRKIDVDIIHIHSIQGIYKEFFEVARKLEIPMVMTTHDYFPICPKTNKLYFNEICYSRDPSKCIVCNSTCDFNWKKQCIYQSSLFDNIKNNKLFLKLKKRSSNKINKDPIKFEVKSVSQNSKKLFNDLITYYNELLSNINAVHYNSNLSKHIYEMETRFEIEKVVPILPNLGKRTIHKKTNNDFFNIGFLGGPNRIKGFNFLRETCENLLSEEITNFCINYYGGSFNIEDTRYEKFYGCFNSSQADDVWNTIDVLVVPSTWLETFGFVIVEALNRCIPVICSDTCGAKDFVTNVDTRCVFKSGDKDDFKQSLKFILNDLNYDKVQKAIINKNYNFIFENHVHEMIDYYQSIINYVKLN